MGTISILCPTRGRPANIMRLVKSMEETASDPGSVELVLYFDKDDETRWADEIRDVFFFSKIGGIKMNTGERITLSKMWNDCYERATGDICMHAGDDIVFKTPGWDKIVIDKFAEIPDKIAFVYGSDGIQPESFGTHGFLHRNWVDTVGYFVPPFFSSDYNDTWLNDVSLLIGRKYHVPIMTEHMHFSVGKAEVDQNTRDRLERHANDKVWEIYNKSYPQRVEDASKLRDFINNFK